MPVLVDGNTTNVLVRVRQMPGRVAHPMRASRRQGDMATPELISLIVVVIAWIVLLGGLAPDG
jgi:hypothetical protein